MLFHGADPNEQSNTGCTPLHLSLYHQDVDSAVQLVNRAAELHLLWKKVRIVRSFRMKSVLSFLFFDRFVVICSQNDGSHIGMIWARQKCWP
jgi:ankyrin repeat protein